MTTERTGPSPRRRRKRPHPAATARVVAAGLAATATGVLVAAFGLGAGGGQAALSPTATPSPSATYPSATQPPPQRYDSRVGRSAGDPVTGTAGRSVPTTRSQAQLTATGVAPGPIAAASGVPSSEAVGAVMGTTAHLVALGDVDVGRGLEELRGLEALWSRFIETSELSRLGRLGGAPAVVSAHTALLIEMSERARELTGGLFDATLLDALEAAGYDRTFELLEPAVDPDGSSVIGADPMLPEGLPCVDLARRPPIEADPRTGLVRLPPGLRIDPGGIGKGLAADLVAAWLLDRGATGSLVSVGGDLRVGGVPPANGWEIELDHHVVSPARINLRSGAVATSTRLRRRWRTVDGAAHHIIDPRTGRPSSGPVVAVSVVAAEAWRAEAVANSGAHRSPHCGVGRARTRLAQRRRSAGHDR